MSHNIMCGLLFAGKPVFTRYGEEGALAGFTALLQVLAASAANRGDSIQSIRSAAGSEHAAHHANAHLSF